jgi:hypothetical protein
VPADIWARSVSDDLLGAEGLESGTLRAQNGDDLGRSLCARRHTSGVPTLTEITPAEAHTRFTFDLR